MRTTDVLTNETAVLGNEQNVKSASSIERICGIIAHDIKNPVNNILLSSDALNEMNLNEEQASFVEMIKRNTERINNLLTELVDATHVAQLEIRTVNLPDLLDEVLGQVNLQLHTGAITIKRNYTHNGFHASVDEVRLKKALLQLVVNAVEAMEQSGGVLEISVFSEKNASVIEIKDNGTGIAEELQLQIFEPYFTSKQGKRGLGLTLAQTIILSHGGSLTVHSFAPHGTTVTVRLPATNLLL